MRRTLKEDITRIKQLMIINEGESQIESSEKKIIDEFMDFIKKELSIEKNIQISLQDNKEGIKTTAVYKYVDGGDEGKAEVKVYVKDRAIIDILRSIAHEFVHHSQNEKGKLKGIKNYVSGPIEDEANSTAGDLLKKFGKTNPEIYDKQEEMKEQEDFADGDDGVDGGESSDSANANVTKWESGVARGKANQIDNTSWDADVSRGKSNPLGNEGPWESGITRGKANPLN